MRVPPRRLTVLVSLDVAGYSRLVDEDERGTLSELARIRMKIMRPTLAAYSGNLFKTMGDGALIEFPNVEDAVRWAVEFQTQMAARNSGLPSPILVRAGVALADVFVQGNDRFGAAVGFVVRLQQAATPGSIAITHSVRWQLVKGLAAQFTRRERAQLKGIDEPIELWMWTPEGASPDTGTAVRRQPQVQADLPVIPTSAESDRPSIAVLAFDNMSGDAQADSIADGVVEEITATLSRIRDFTVIARNSAYAYKGQARDIRMISRELGVRYVLEGSLRKAGNRIRITAQLIDAATGTHLWADRYEGLVEYLFDFEDQIAEKVAGALHPSILAAEIARARRKHPDSLAAYDLVLKALPHLWSHRPEDNAEAIRLLDAARAADPTYARATAVAAWARAQHVVYNWTSDIEKVRAEGRVLIEDASPGASDDPTALTALATATMLLHADMRRAKFFVDRALELDPNYAWAWTRRGFLEVYGGHPEQAIIAFDRAIRLSPLDPFSFNCFIGIGLASFSLGKPEDAVAWTERAMREKSGMTWAYRDLAVFLAAAGRIEEAKAACAELVATRPHLTLAGVRDSLRFMEPTLLDRYVEGLRLAGLRP